MRQRAPMRRQTTTFPDDMALDCADARRGSTWHISRLVRLPPAAAEAACDAFRATARRGPAREDGQLPGAWSVPVPGGHLVLYGGGQMLGRGRLDPYRRWFGYLAADGTRRTVPVEVQLCAWSSARCELGMRPATRSGAVGTRHRRLFFDAGNAALDGMVREIDRLAGPGVVDPHAPQAPAAMPA